MRVLFVLACALFWAWICLLTLAGPAFSQAHPHRLSGAELQNARRGQCGARFGEYQRAHPGVRWSVFMRRCLSGAFDRYGHPAR